jgi:hypothetical protein
MEGLGDSALSVHRTANWGPLTARLYLGFNYDYYWTTISNNGQRSDRTRGKQRCHSSSEARACGMTPRGETVHN